jgi:hypothetical protein
MATNGWEWLIPSDARRIRKGCRWLVWTLFLNSYQPSRHVLVCIVHNYCHEYCPLLTLFATFKRNPWPKSLQANALLPYNCFYRRPCDLCKPWGRQTKEAGAQARVLWCLEQVRDFSNFARVFSADTLADREEEELYAK